MARKITREGRFDVDRTAAVGHVFNVPENRTVSDFLRRLGGVLFDP